MLGIFATSVVMKIIRAVTSRDPNAIVGGLTRDAVASRMHARSRAVAEAMVARGMTLENLATDGTLTDREKKTVIRDVVFRLWREVLTFEGAGHVADHIRDTQQNAVYEKLLAGVDAATSMEALVDMVRAAVIEITF